MVNWSRDVTGALLTGNLSQRLERGQEKFAVSKTRGLRTTPQACGQFLREVSRKSFLFVFVQ